MYLKGAQMNHKYGVSVLTLTSCDASLDNFGLITACTTPIVAEKWHLH